MVEINVWLKVKQFQAHLMARRGFRRKYFIMLGWAQPSNTAEKAKLASGSLYPSNAIFNEDNQSELDTASLQTAPTGFHPVQKPQSFETARQNDENSTQDNLATNNQHQAVEDLEVEKLKQPVVVAGPTLHRAPSYASLKDVSMTSTTTMFAAESARTSQQSFAHLQCRFCRKLMTSDRRPLLLECGHSFCRDCVLQMPVFSGCKGVKLWSGLSVDDSLIGDSGDLLPHDIVQHSGFLRVDSTSGSAVNSPRLKSTSSVPAGSKSVTDLLTGFIFGRFNGTPVESVKDVQEDDNDLEESAKARRQSLMSQSASEKYGYIQCLDCREKIHLTKRGLEDVEENEFLAASADKAADTMSICADCQGSKTNTFCQECNLYLCHPCSHRIHSGVMTSQHHVYEFRGTEHEVPISSKPPQCTQHPKEESVLYCYSCEELACVMCAYGNHKRHNVCLLTDAIGELKQKLRQRTKLAADKLQDVSKAKSDIKMEVDLLQENSVAAKAFICKKIDEIKQSLLQMETEMCARVDEESADKESKLLKQEIDMLALEMDLKLRVQLANTVLQNQNAGEVIEPITRQIRTLKTAISEIPSDALSLCTTAAINVSTNALAKSLYDTSLMVEEDSFPRNPSTIKQVAATPMVRPHLKHIFTPQMSTGSESASKRARFSKEDSISNIIDQQNNVTHHSSIDTLTESTQTKNSRVEEEVARSGKKKIIASNSSSTENINKVNGANVRKVSAATIAAAKKLTSTKSRANNQVQVLTVDLTSADDEETDMSTTDFEDAPAQVTKSTSKSVRSAAASKTLTQKKTAAATKSTRSTRKSSTAKTSKQDDHDDETSDATEVMSQISEYMTDEDDLHASKQITTASAHQRTARSVGKSSRRQLVSYSQPVRMPSNEEDDFESDNLPNLNEFGINIK